VSRIAESLRAGGPRTVEGVAGIVADVLDDPAIIEELVRALAHDDALVRMRAADAAEKIGRTNPQLLDPFKSGLLRAAASSEQPSLRWHLAQMLPRLRLDAGERKTVAAMLKRYLHDSSAIVKTCAMQGLADLALADASLRRSIVPVLRKATETGTPAMRARGKRLLAALDSRTGVRAP
jgi:hypothetical protein